MHENESFEPLEERLAAEAQRLSADSYARPPIAGLRAEFIRRHRRRVVARSLFATATVVAVGFVAARWNHRSEHDVGQAGNESQSAGDSRVAASLPGISPDENPAADIAAIAGADHGSFAAIAILIPQTGDDGEQRLVLAWYVPGQLEEIDTCDLSPAERSAVSQLLGPDYETSEDPTI